MVLRKHVSGWKKDGRLNCVGVLAGGGVIRNRVRFHLGGFAASAMSYGWELQGEELT